MSACDHDIHKHLIGPCPDAFRSPTADEKLRAIEFLTGLTTAPGEPGEGTVEVAERDAARSALAAASALHAPQRLYPEFRFGPWCGECSTGIVTHSDDGSFTHQVRWPCPTARALGIVDPLAPAASPEVADGEPS